MSTSTTSELRALNAARDNYEQGSTAWWAFTRSIIAVINAEIEDRKTETEAAK